MKNLLKDALHGIDPIQKVYYAKYKKACDRDLVRLYRRRYYDCFFEYCVGRFLVYLLYAIIGTCLAFLVFAGFEMVGYETIFRFVIAALFVPSVAYALMALLPKFMMHWDLFEPAMVKYVRKSAGVHRFTLVNMLTEGINLITEKEPYAKTLSPNDIVSHYSVADNGQTDCLRALDILYNSKLKELDMHCREVSDRIRDVDMAIAEYAVMPLSADSKYKIHALTDKKSSHKTTLKTIENDINELKAGLHEIRGRIRQCEMDERLKETLSVDVRIPDNTYDIEYMKGVVNIMG